MAHIGADAVEAARVVVKLALLDKIGDARRQMAGGVKQSARFVVAVEDDVEFFSLSLYILFSLNRQPFYPSQGRFSRRDKGRVRPRDDVSASDPAFARASGCAT